MSYGKFLSRFLDEAPIASDDRRRKPARTLERNELGLSVASELANPGPLTSKCRKFARSRGDVYVRDTLQQALKQMTAWAASGGVISYDPLASWKKIPRKSEKRKRSAFLPEQVRAILEAAAARSYDSRSEPKQLPTWPTPTQRRPPRWTPMWTSFAAPPVLMLLQQNGKTPKSLTWGRLRMEPARGFKPRTCALRMRVDHRIRAESADLSLPHPLKPVSSCTSCCTFCCTRTCQTRMRRASVSCRRRNWVVFERLAS